VITKKTLKAGHSIEEDLPADL